MPRRGKAGAVSLAERLTHLPLDTALDTRDARNVPAGSNRVDGLRGFFIPTSQTLLVCPKTEEPLPIRHDVGMLLFDSRRVIIAASTEDFASAVGKGFDAIAGN